MKIGILTFHRAVNFGAVLQAYALQHTISSLGYDCELIDYRNEKFEKEYSPVTLGKCKSFRQIMSFIVYGHIRNKKITGFRDFIKKECGVSKKIYTSNNITDTNAVYDRIITGSDQVWNLNLTDGDYHYFLDFISDDDKKCSYAASIVTDSYTEEEIRIINGALVNYKALSVREISGRDYLLTINPDLDVKLTVDPTLLLEKQVWEHKSLLGKNTVPKHYLLVYFVSPNEENYKQALLIANIMNLKPVLINYSHKKESEFINKRSTTPYEFLYLIDNADYVVTNSFHGTAFSINFEKSFTYILNNSHPEKNERINTLVQNIGLEDRNIIYNNFTYIDDWTSSRSKLEILRKESLMFIKRSILDE